MLEDAVTQSCFKGVGSLLPHVGPEDQTGLGCKALWEQELL